MEQGLEIVKELNKNFQTYANRFSGQFHLQIPKHVLNTVQFYRENFFDYLKNSVFKSNICYLMQLLDYQIWLYKVFKPGLSLENAYFYQMLTTMGIIAEAISATILLNPLIEEDQKDVSLGSIPSRHDILHGRIVNNHFTDNIRLLRKYKILPESLIEEFTKTRTKIRNLVHIQNWEGRLYNQLGLDQFSEYLESFRKFLMDLKAGINMQHTADELNREFFHVTQIDAEKHYEGTIVQFNPEKGYGFIQSDLLEREIYFHRSSFIAEKDQLFPGEKIQFKLVNGKKGIEAASVAKDVSKSAAGSEKTKKE